MKAKRVFLAYVTKTTVDKDDSIHITREKLKVETSHCRREVISSLTNDYPTENQVISDIVLREVKT